MGEHLNWAKEITPDDNSNPQKQMKRIINDKKVNITIVINISLFSFILSDSSKDIKSYGVISITMYWWVFNIDTYNPYNNNTIKKGKMRTE